MFGNINLLALIFHGVVISLCCQGGLAVISQTNPASYKNPGFISIDCGAPKGYLEEFLDIWYQTDFGYIDSGVNMEVSPEFTRSNLFSMVKTLRSFPYGIRNCYTLRPEKGENSTFLIRAYFFYGNYDEKNEMPIFDLYIGVNKWATIHLLNVQDSRYYEIYIVPPEGDVQVCLVNTGYGNPFINGIELRILENALYQSGLGALSLTWRDSAAKEDVRYPDDVYDRVWKRSWNAFSNYYWPSISNESIFKTYGTSGIYKVPDKVLMTAAESLNASIPLCRSYSDASTTTWQVYFHFAEVQQLENGWKRKVKVSINKRTTEAISLQYAKPTILSMPLYGTMVNFCISAAGGSKLPPIVNAIELFRIIDLPNVPTLVTDVDAIAGIKKMYSIPKDWQGDPCVPRNLTWESIKCSYNNPSRIVSLNLSSCKLAGGISTSFSKLDKIQMLDLSYNELSGPLPKFLGELPNLKILYLMGNNFTGVIPPTLKNKVQVGTLDLRLAGNPLCQTEHCEESKKSTKKRSIVPIITSVSSTVAVLVILCALILFWRVKRIEDTIRHFQKEGLIIKSRNRPFRYNEVLQITRNLKTVIGEGGFGKVYLGDLTDGTKVAVKLLSETSMQGHKEFQVEAQLLMIVHHKNLVSLIGYCHDRGNMALIYEYMANGSLSHHLSETRTKVLSWKQRLQIAVDVAQGLEYLHNGCVPPIVHRDLKPSNILLDENMQAKIADFGLSKRFLTESATHVTTRVAGTYGYVDPEFHATNSLSKASDVYSFGIILFELITGRSAIVTSPVESILIIDWAKPLIDRGDILTIVDKSLHGKFEINSTWKAIEIAKSCTMIPGIQRPDMSIVLVELKQCLAIQLDSDNNLDGVRGNLTYSRFTDGGACMDSEAFSLISAR